MNIAVILAGGTGSRIGVNIPKQFIEIQGKPLMAYTLEIYQHSKNIDAIEIVCIKSYMDEVKSIVNLYGISKAKWFIEGGNTFQESTVKGILNLKDKIKDSDIILLTFAVSPMVTDEIIDDAIRVCKEHGNAIPADEMIMCTCIKDDDYSSTKSILRETLVGLNGPWTFNYGEVRKAYEMALNEGYLDALEPHTTSLYFHQGRRIWFSKSATNNIKITRREDLDMFEGYLLLQEKRKQQIN